jgi:hypothetical protein
MKPARKVLAVALVAAALCADRAVAAAPSSRLPVASSVAGRLVARLSVRFQRVVPSARIYEPRRDGIIDVVSGSLRPSHDHTTAGFGARLFAPFQLRLPPPTSL